MEKESIALEEKLLHIPTFDTPVIIDLNTSIETVKTQILKEKILQGKEKFKLPLRRIPEPSESSVSHSSKDIPEERDQSFDFAVFCHHKTPKIIYTWL